MSDFSPRRALLFTLFVFLFATAASAAVPTGRLDARMVYNAATTHTILFGGTTANDPSTKAAYELSDTWDWNGQLWTQLFPLHIPTARYGHVMVYDSARQRIVIFGGRTGNNKNDLNDTWVFKDGDWTKIDTPNAPEPRVLAGGTYDPLRDRVVVFGGASVSADGKSTTQYHDTWEFDGTTWTKILSEGPTVDKPLMTWDGARHVILMLAVDSKIASHQFTYDPAAKVWNEKTGTGLPTCANEGMIVFQARNNTVYFTGGACSGVSGVEDNLEWDGDKWNVITVKTNVGRLFGAAMTYDAFRQQVLLFGGNAALSGAPRNETWAYNGDWTPVFDFGLTPGARSLFSFLPDPVGGGIWLLGGVDGIVTNGDFWKLQYGKWQRVPTVTPPPQACASPASAFDTVRQKLVVVCADSTTAEFDLTDWKTAEPKHVPDARAFRRLVYDENIKKSVLFGGYLNPSYVNETWLWDGTDWSEVTRNLPPWRILPAMWFDTHLNRTVIFGGLGQAERQGRVVRFNDMWSFDGTGWTEIKPAHVPPPHYGAQWAVDPRNGNVLLFGGMRADTVETPGTGDNPPTEVQVYADDFWQWDGTDWTQVTYPRIPYARENAGLAWDSSTGTFVIYGGYAGQQYFSDLWTLTTDKGWQPLVTNVIRRRSTGR